MALVGQRRVGHGPSSLDLPPRTKRLFGALDAHDRGHLAAVHSVCVANGLSSEIAVAGLLHDIGKASLSGRRVNLLERSLRVLLGSFSPVALLHVAREPAMSWRLGLHLNEHHPELGAGRLVALGWPEPVVAAVLGHEANRPSGEMATLKRIDDSTV